MALQICSATNKGNLVSLMTQMKGMHHPIFLTIIYNRTSSYFLYIHFEYRFVLYRYFSTHKTLVVLSIISCTPIIPFFFLSHHPSSFFFYIFCIFFFFIFFIMTKIIMECPCIFIWISHHNRSSIIC